MRKILAVLWLMVLCASAWAMNFPELGVCVGDNVRLRDSPNTKSRVIGRADAGTRFVILSETRSGGKKWYRIDHPTKKGSAYIAAEFVNGWYNEGKIPVGKDFADIRLNFGMTPEKTKLLLGKPTEENAQDEFEYLTYRGCDVHFEEQYLSYVHVHKRGYEIAGCQVGDNASKLVVFGMPENELPDLTDEKYKNWDAEEDGPIGPEGWTYESASGEAIFFGFEYTGEEVRIETITWSCPRGEG